MNGELNGSDFHWRNTPINGNGPTGDVTGTVSPQGVFQATKVGTSCSFGKIVPMMNSYSN